MNPDSALQFLLLLLCMAAAAVIAVLWQRRQKSHVREIHLSEAARQSLEKHHMQEREASMELLGLLNTPNELVELVRSITVFLQRLTNCAAVGVRLREGDDFPYFETRGFPAEFVRAESLLCTRDLNGQIARDSLGKPLLECMCGNVIRGRFNPELSFFTAKGSFWSNCTTELLATTTEADRQARTRNRCNGEGYESVALIPLRTGNETLGLLQLNDKTPGRFSTELLSFLEYAADQIAMAIAQRKAQKSLRESEELYRSLFKNMLNGFAYCRMLFENGAPSDFIYLAVNDAFGTQTGLKEVVGKRVSEVIPGIRESDPELFRIYGRVALTGIPESCEIYVDSLKMWFSIAVYSPEREHFVAVFDVITERKRAEESLRRSEQLNRSLVKHLPLYIFIKDRQSSYLLCNENYAHDLGIEPVEITGKDDFAFHPPDLAEEYRADDQAVMASGRRKDIEERYVVNGQERWVHTIKMPYHDEQGQVIGVLGIFEDITERRRLQEEKKKVEVQLLQAQKMESVGRLAGGVAHDFNNMLNVILGYSELALEKMEPSDSIHGDIMEIRKAAERSADLTRQLLAFASKQIIEPRPLDLNEAVEGILKMLRRLIGEDINLSWKPGHGLWPVRMDPAQIDQILANLTVNARDAIAGVGRIIIETENVTFDEAYCTDHAGFIPGDYVMFSLSDDGCGMEKEVLAHIFEPFFTTKGVGRGTGLGLATVYGIVKQNKGFINVYSEPGKGTTFSIYLARHSGEVSADTEELRAAPPVGGKETVLLVEDEAAVLRLNKGMLERLGYRVLPAGSPAEAIRLVEKHGCEIHLLITDMVMPEMNGRDLAGKLRDLCPSQKQLFMSGYTADVIAGQGVLDEGMHFIQKPFSLRDLAAKVRFVLGSPT